MAVIVCVYVYARKKENTLFFYTNGNVLELKFCMHIDIYTPCVLLNVHGDDDKRKLFVVYKAAHIYTL